MPTAEIPLRARWRRMLPVAVVAALFWVALAAWSFASPSYSSPDDDFHLPRIACAAGQAVCDPVGNRVSPCFAGLPAVTGDCRPLASVVDTEQATRSRIRLGPEAVPVTVGVSDGRPELYERVAAQFAGATVDDTSRAVRLLNVTLAVVMAVASVLLTAPRLRRAVALGWLVASVPVAFFVVSSTNAQSWTIIGIAGLWGPLVGLLGEARRDRITALRAGYCALGALLAVGSRSEGPFFLFVVALAAAALVWPRPGDRRGSGASPRTRRLLAGLAVLAVICAGVTVALSAARLSFLVSLPGPGAGPWQVALDGVTQVVMVVSDPLLGWLDTPMPALVGALATAMVGGTLLVGIADLDRRKVVALGIIATALIGMALFTAWKGQGQPRYYLPLVMPLVGMALVPVGRGRPPTRVQAAAVLAGLAVVNSVSLLATLERFLLGHQASLISPTALAAVGSPGWWLAPLPPAALWALGSLAGTAAVVGVWLLLWPPRAGREQRSVVDVRTHVAEPV